MRPMLASRGDRVPAGPEWAHEVKWDGMRVLVAVSAAGLRVFSRNENDVSAGYPELSGLAETGREMLLDGEVVALADGVPSFAALAERMHVTGAARARRLAEQSPVTLMAFDLLALEGRDLSGEPWRVRRAALEALELPPGAWQVPPVYDDGAALLAATAQRGLEGVVSKRRSSRYRFGTRSRDWLKLAHRATRSYVVGGWRPETGSAHRLGAVLVGEPTSGGALTYRGRVGSGVAGRAGAALARLIEPLVSAEPPFADPVPAVDADGATWVRPELVVEVASLGLTPAGRLRQPAYLGVREDLAPADLAAEAGDG